MIDKAYIMSLVKEVDGVTLTEKERIAAAFLIAFLSMNVSEALNRNTVDVMSKLRRDWYISVTFSDV